MDKSNLSLGFDVSDDIKREFTIDEKGVITASQRGVARLLGITHKLLVPPLAVTLSQSLADAGFKGGSFGDGVTDVEFAIVATYVAFESQSTNPQAVAVVKTLTAIGSRKLFQSIVGLESAESEALPATELDRIYRLSICSSTRKDAPQDKLNLPGWLTVREMLNRAGEENGDEDGLVNDFGFRYWINRHIADLYRAQYKEEPPVVMQSKTKAYCYPPDYQSFVNLYRKNWILQAA